MSVADDFTFGPIYTATPQTRAETPAPTGPGEPADAPRPTRIPHRLAIVRQQQGVSVRSAARRMGVPMQQVRQEERPDSDLRISDLVRWQRALEVPLADLLEDNDAPLSEPVMKRARWLRLMKTIKALVELNASPAANRMARMLEQQVTEIAPELSEVGAWHSVGQRRTQEELGRVVEQLVPRTFARDGLS